MKDYQKIILFLYPKLKRLIVSVGEIARARAVASGADFATERCAEKIMEYIRFRDCLIVLEDDMQSILGELGREELYLLEYKYFRRKKMLEKEFADVRLACSERTYFRRQTRLESRLNGLFMRRGMSEEWFMRTFGEFPYIADALGKLRECGQTAFADKRTKNSLAREGKRGA